MCGIAGFSEFKEQVVTNGDSYSTLKSMLDVLHHRGPDDYGMSFHGYKVNADDPKVRVENSGYRLALGHRRLSIIDLSENGRQPMTISNGMYEIIFNGEIYNYIELREEIGGSFFSETDSEVLLKGYEKWGLDIFGKLDGMFSFVLLDKKQNLLLCARDPAGIKPFYYNKTSSSFVFASEPRAVLTALRISGSIDTTRTSEFLMMGISDHDEGTFFKEVKQLPGGYYMTVSLDGKVNAPVKYWSPSTIDNDVDVLGGVKDRLFLSVKRQLRSDVKLGTSLSGGIDSGTIVTIAGELLKDSDSRYDAFTFTFPEFDDDEIEMAGIIADNAGMDLIPVNPSIETMTKDLEKMIINMGEPFSTLSMFAQYKVMQAAANNGTKVMLDGQGGDEIYLGYPRVAQRILGEYLKKFKLLSFFNEWIGLKKHASLPLWRSLAGNFLFRSPSFFLNKNKSRLIDFVNIDLLNNFRAEVAEDVYSNKPIEKIQIDEFTKYCLPRLLRYEDRNSMAFSIESRVPHLSQPLLDFAFKLPLHWRVNKGWTKYSVRKAMSGKLPGDVLWSNKKQGFPVPQKYWVEKLRPVLPELMPGDSDLFNITNILRKIDSGGGNDPHLWRVISTACWINLLNVKS